MLCWQRLHSQDHTLSSRAWIVLSAPMGKTLVTLELSQRRKGRWNGARKTYWSLCQQVFFLHHFNLEPSKILTGCCQHWSGLSSNSAVWEIFSLFPLSLTFRGPRCWREDWPLMDSNCHTVILAPHPLLCGLSSTFFFPNNFLIEAEKINCVHCACELISSPHIHLGLSVPASCHVTL